MKTIKFITHPAAVIVSFLIIIISGEHFGGFYLLYLLLALPHGGLHSILAVVGIFLILHRYKKFETAYRNAIAAILKSVGVICLWLSLFTFFYNDKSGYNSATFEQLVPVITLVLFTIFSLAFLARNIFSNLNSGTRGKLLV